jgi:molybdopterin biosynthesis enzyme
MALDVLEGVERPGPSFVSARLTHRFSVRGRRETFSDATLESAAGELRVAPLETHGSHDLGAYARANALLRIPANSEDLEAGTIVECLLLGDLT